MMTEDEQRSMIAAQKWRVERVGNSFDIVTTRDGMRRPIAFIAVHPDSADEMRAVASAIAALPDMLLALKAADECSLAGQCAYCSSLVTDALEAAAHDNA